MFLTCWGPCQYIKMPSYQYRNFQMKIRWSHYCLIFIRGIPIPSKIVFILRWNPGLQFNIKMSSYQYRKSHCGDKTVVRSSYLHNGISYTGKMSSLYWIRPWCPCIMIIPIWLTILQTSRWYFCDSGLMVNLLIINFMTREKWCN